MGKTLADEQEQEQDQDKGRGTHFTHVQMQIRPEHVKEIVTSGNVSRAAPDVGQAFWVGGGLGCGQRSPKRTSFLEPCPATWPVYSRNSRCLGAVARLLVVQGAQGHSSTAR